MACVSQVLLLHIIIISSIKIFPHVLELHVHRFAFIYLKV